ncbi:hypothetical protein BH23ACT5_BH23ACT5_03160 [soil metagenome]
MDPRDHALRRALVADDATDLVSLDDLSTRTGLSLPLLEALAREGLLVPRTSDPEPRYHLADADSVRAGLEMVGAGLPLAELLEMARLADEAMRPVAEAAVDAFVRYVTDPLEGTSTTSEEAANRMVAAFETMLPAAGRLVSHHFQRLLVDDARRRLNP